MSTNELNPGQPKAPTYIAYHVRETAGAKGKKSFWTRIGAAWEHADGKGFSIDVEAIPLTGRITLRVATERKK